MPVRIVIFDFGGVVAERYFTQELTPECGEAAETIRRLTGMFNDMASQMSNTDFAVERHGRTIRYRERD